MGARFVALHPWTSAKDGGLIQACYYRSLAKQRPWAEHLTSLSKRGVNALSSVSAINHKRAPMSCFQRLNDLKANKWMNTNVQRNHKRLQSCNTTLTQIISGFQLSNTSGSPMLQVNTTPVHTLIAQPCLLALYIWTSAKRGRSCTLVRRCTRYLCPLANNPLSGLRLSLDDNPRHET